MGVDAAVDGREHAERERDRRADAGPQDGKDDDGEDARDQRDRGGEACWVERDAGAGEREGVVEGVEQRDDGRAANTSASPSGARRRQLGRGMRGCVAGVPRSMQSRSSPGGRGHAARLPLHGPPEMEAPRVPPGTQVRRRGAAART